MNFIMIKDNILNLASLNCNSLRKTSNISARNSMIRYLREHPSNLNIITLQETNAIDDATKNTFNILFRTQQTIWTSHCGIIALDPDLSLQQIPINLHNNDLNSRIIFTKVSSQQQLFTPFYLLTLYAPAHATAPRQRFFTALLDSPIFNSTSPLYTDRLFITGDFNENIHRLFKRQDGQISPWITRFKHELVDCITDVSNSLALPTYRQGASYHNTLDFILASSSFRSSIHQGEVAFVSRDWTDHALLIAHVQVDSPITGKGYWRGNPNFSRIPEFRQELASMLDNLWSSLSTLPSDQTRWEKLKSALRRFTQQFGRKRTKWREQQLKALMSKRNRILRSKPPANILAQFLPRVEKQISILQQELVDISALKARQRWREKGEVSAGYLKKIAQKDLSCRMISSLRHPNNDTICTDTEDLQDAAISFYEKLYTPEDMDLNALNDLLHSSSLPQLSPSDQEDLISEFAIDDLLHGAKRAPKHSSPGPDGLPYSTWYLVFQHPQYQELACRIYNSALQQSVYPPSWQETCVTLLPKKGDLQSLRNWRPISLINTDAKIFTRLLNARLVQVADTLINQFQTGFLPKRFIADNGMLAKIAMEQARGHESSSSIALLLDQEKAYDRIHPAYLQRILDTFGIPTAFSSTITDLFFSTKIQVNINGHLSASFTQQRGLRQGDPISPILFNLALEPLLRAILADDSFQGISLNTVASENISLPTLPPLKCLAYADDVMIFLSTPSDLHRLQLHLSKYQSASNAKLNPHKSQAISLSGNRQPEWNTFLQQSGFPTCHDRTWLEPIIYLGYPLASSKSQLDEFLAKLLLSIKSLCNQHSLRHLSLRGRATILNSLILSTTWHVLRLTGAPIKSFFRPLRSTMGSFLMNQMFPRISLEKMYQPLDCGGLGVLDPELQQGALQLRWLEPLTHPQEEWNISTIALAHHLHHQQSSSSDHRFTLFIPSCRKLMRGQCNDITNILIKAIDQLKLHLDTIPFNISTVLHLPLNTIWKPTPGHNPTRQGYKKLLVKDIFYFNLSTNHIHFRPWTVNHHHHTRNKFLAKAFSQNLSQQQITLVQFFQQFFSSSNPSSLSAHTPTHIDATPLTSHLDALFIKQPWKTRVYRQLCRPPIPIIDCISRSAWNRFWHTPMEHGARNVWLRAIHNSIPTLTRLESAGIDRNNGSVLCRLCKQAPDTLDHFLLYCPSRLPIWQEMWNNNLQSTFDPFRLIQFIKFLRIPPSTSSSGKVITICSCYLWALWQHYWLHIIHNTPYHPQLVIATAHKLMAKQSSSH